jgi:hypothetical protein
MVGLEDPFSFVKRKGNVWGVAITPRTADLTLPLAVTPPENRKFMFFSPGFTILRCLNLWGGEQQTLRNRTARTAEVDGGPAFPSATPGTEMR